MTSVAMRILGATTEPEKYTYESACRAARRGDADAAGWGAGGRTGRGRDADAPAGWRADGRADARSGAERRAGTPGAGASPG